MSFRFIYKLYLLSRRTETRRQISNLIRLLKRRLSKIRVVAQRDQYVRDSGRTDADPEKIVWVSPNEVRYETATYFGKQLNKYGQVAGGKWDLVRTKFTERMEFQSLRRHFHDKVEWRRTAYYIHIESIIKSGGAFRGLTSMDDVDQFFDHLDELYRSIDRNGYQSQEQLEQDAKNPQTGPGYSGTEQMDEIGVNIARDGRVLWQNCGQHRLCIAKLLAVDAVPVYVCTRHEAWQRIRDQIRIDEPVPEQLEADYSDHPDLLDLFEAN